MHTKLDTPEIVLITAILTLSLTSLLYKFYHEPQGPTSAIIVQDGTVDVWSSEHLEMIDGILYITNTSK
jgi:hypothetical protein